MVVSEDDVQGLVIEILRRRVSASQTISTETKMVQDLGLDSIAVMNFVMDLEDRFDISIPLDRIAEVETVGDLSVAIATLMGTSK